MPRSRQRYDWWRWIPTVDARLNATSVHDVGTDATLETTLRLMVALDSDYVDVRLNATSVHDVDTDASLETTLRLVALDSDC